MTEAIRIPTAGAVFWAEAMPDGSGGVRAITGRPPALKVSLISPLPRGVSAMTSSRGIALMGLAEYYDHLPSEPELAAPLPGAGAALQGVVESLDGRYLPRQFSVTADPAAPTYVPLHPSLQATRITEAGAVVLNLKWQDGSPASWTLLRLTCVRNGAPLGFSAQADGAGDIIVPLTGLPPLTPPQVQDVMTLTARGDPALSGQALGDPDTLPTTEVSSGGPFAAQLTLPVIRGRITNAATLAIAGVTLQPI